LHDYKDLIEEIRAEFDQLEAGAATRLHALLDQLVGHDGSDTEHANGATGKSRDSG
jgi:hypothetical protein